MYKQKIETQLKDIFGVEKVTFTSAADDKIEQDVLFVEPLNVLIDTFHSYKYMVLHAKLKITTTQNKLPPTWFHNHILNMKPHYTLNIIFGNKVNAEKITIGDNVLEIYTLDFAWYDKSENSSTGILEDVKF
jgi:hypothetical protein